MDRAVRTLFTVPLSCYARITKFRASRKFGPEFRARFSQVSRLVHGHSQASQQVMWIRRLLSCSAFTILVISVIVGYLAHLPIENEDIVDSMASNVDEKMTAFREKNQTAFVVGYTGEVGKEVVKELARTNIFSNVFLIGRREVKYEDELFKDFKMEQKVVDFDKLDDSADVFKGHCVGINALGTTKGKAGKEGFKKVDHDFAMKVGELAKAGGCQHYHLISSTGANHKSSFLYQRVKGQVEEETRELGFERVSVYRPALLMCNRQESRPGEWLAQKLFAPMEYLTPGTFTSPTSTVAKAVIKTIVSPMTQPFEIFDSKTIQRIAFPQKSTASGAKTPAATETPAPATTDTKTPPAADTETPAAADTQTPAATDTQVDTQTPVATDTKTPAAIDTQTPAATDTETPAATDTQTPAATDTETPAAADTQAPAVTDTQTPAATEQTDKE